MAVARISKKTLLGSHIPMIFHWVKQQQSKGLIKPIPNISSPSTEPLQQYPEEPPIANGKQPKEVAQATKSNKGKAIVGASKVAQGNDTTMASSDSEDLTLIEIFPKRPRRGAASRVDSLEAAEQPEDHAEEPPHENNHVEVVEESEEEETERKPPLVEDGPHLPHYLRRWLARTVKEQRTRIKDLVTQVEQITNAYEYDKLVKEKSSWFSTKEQLEDELRDDRLAMQKVIKERDEGRLTLAKNAEVIQKNAQLFMTVNQDRSKLQVDFTRVTTEKQELHKTMARLKSNIIDLEKQVVEAMDEKNKVLQDMENSQDRTEAILEQIALLEARVEGPLDPLDKCQRNA
ncbi:unnamed protein product [Calypogeia fissa]